MRQSSRVWFSTARGTIGGGGGTIAAEGRKMPRPNRPWYRADRGEWYMTIDGVKTRLRVFDPDDADGALRAAESLRGGVPTVTGCLTVADAVARFTADELPSRSEATRESYAMRMRWVGRRFGWSAVAELDPREVERAAQAEGWSDGTRRLTLTVFQLVVRRSGRPDFTLTMPPWGQRDKRCVLSRDELTAALNLCSGDFGPLVQWLFLTGCRPSEGRLLTADMVDWRLGEAVIDAHKTRGKTRKPKTVYLSPSAMDILTRHQEKYGGGFLFRRPDGKPFSRSSVQERWRRIRGSLGLRSQVVPYSMRHSFATHLLEGGATSRDVAELLGHTSTQMVEKIYGHFINSGRLRDVAGKLGG